MHTTPRPAHAANADSAFYDLFATLHLLARVLHLPVDHLEALVTRIEALPGPFDQQPIGTILQLVHDAAAKAAAGQAATLPASPVRHMHLADNQGDAK